MRGKFRQKGADALRAFAAVVVCENLTAVLPCRGNAAVHNAVRADAGVNRKIQHAKLLSDAAEIRLRLLRLDGNISRRTVTTQITP